MRALVGVVGAGTMGAGIAQVAAVAGHRVLVADAVPAAAVEVISGLATAPEVADAAADLATRWGKTVVRSTATPGSSSTGSPAPSTPKRGGCTRNTRPFRRPLIRS